MTAVSTASLRAYDVGFGDCLLLRLTYADSSERSVLIDFGSTRLPAGAPSTRMADVAADIAAASRGKLHMVVATHRHADHISGFGAGPSGDAIEAVEPEVVVQPWTEAPDLKTDAREPLASRHPSGHLALAASLNDMHAFAAGASFEGRRLRADDGFPTAVADQLAFLGETNVKNKAAVTRLMTMGRRPAIYTKFGDDLSDDTLLPGVTIKVLGPPTLAQAPAIAHQARTDDNEFWHMAASWGVAAEAGHANPGDLTAAAASLFPDATVPIPQEAEWLVPRITQTYVNGMMSLLRVMDGVLNNTSLILLIRIGATTLLFPGDAQIENWSYALFDAPDHEQIRHELAGTNLYKVGHHGSLNATPKTLWNEFANKGTEEGAPGRLISVVSTLSGKHGSPESHTEVPREALLTALLAKSDFHSTQNHTGNREPWVDIKIPLI